MYNLKPKAEIVDLSSIKVCVGKHGNMLAYPRGIAAS